MDNRPRPTYWHQGLFLQPHHFQYQELFLSGRIDRLRESVNPLLWGVDGIRFREGALEEMVVELQECDVTFQDGTTVSVPHQARAVARSVREYVENIVPGVPMRVYLALPRLNLNGKNATVTAAGNGLDNVRTRFVSVEEEEYASNLLEGGDEAPIGFLNYLLRIVWEYELEAYADWHCLLVGAIESVDGSFRFAWQCIPPVMSIGASPALIGLIRDIQDAMLSRSRLLELYKVSRPLRAEDIEGNYLRYMHALRSLNHYIPMLQQIVEQPFLHPWTVYGSLRQLVGELSTYSDRINALGRLPNGTDLLPSYDHGRLGECFAAVKLLVRELLDAIIVESENVVELTRREECFEGDLPAEAFDKRNSVFLLVRSAGPQEMVLNSLIKHAKVGSPDGIEVLVRRALDGVRLDYRQTPPPGIPVHPDGFIFCLERSGALWDEIGRQRAICLHWDEASEDARAEIIISKR